MFISARYDLAMRIMFAAAALCSISACKRREPEPRVTKPGAIARTTGAIAIDGEWDEPDWSLHALRGQFKGDDGGLARPSSEVRFLHDDEHLLVALYAADEDIEPTDGFDLAVGAVSLHLDATAKLTPPLPGAKAAVGYDEGTLGNPKDDDEEWVIELSIPLSVVGLAPGVAEEARAERCDVPKDGIRRCGRWSGSVTLE